MEKGVPVLVTLLGEGEQFIATFVKVSGTGHRVVRLENGREMALDHLDRVERIVL